jgi:hypothetical protein
MGSAAEKVYFQKIVAISSEIRIAEMLAYVDELLGRSSYDG